MATTYEVECKATVVRTVKVQATSMALAEEVAADHMAEDLNIPTALITTEVISANG